MNLETTVNPVSLQEDNDISYLVDKHSTMLYRFCRTLAYSIADAEDLFQETWFSVIRNQSKLLKSNNPKSYLCSAALYVWKSQQRKYARRKRIAPETVLDYEISSSQNVESDFLSQAEKEIVRDLIGKLSDKYRVPILLFYHLEMDISEIGRVLDLPSGTVKSRLFSARQEIKKGLLKYEKS